MPYAIEQKWIGLGKESVRGTAVEPTKFIAVAPDSEAEYKLNLIEDENIRGIFEKFLPQAGIKEGTGRLGGIDVQSNNIGEILYSLLGSVSTTTPTTGVYEHTFTRHATLIQMPSYTIAIQRGLSAKKYSLAVIKAVSFTGAVDGKLIADVDYLFQTESAYTTPTTPTWTNPTPFMFYQTDFKIAGSSNTSVKDWTLNIDNGAIAHRTLNQSQDCKDILSISKLLISGGFNIYFENETERDKFLANTATSVQIVLTGATISGSYSNKLDITLPEIHYTAYPFGNLDSLLGAAVSYNAYYNLVSGKTVSIVLTNAEASY